MCQNSLIDQNFSVRLKNKNFSSRIHLNSKVRFSKQNFDFRVKFWFTSQKLIISSQYFDFRFEILIKPFKVKQSKIRDSIALFESAQSKTPEIEKERIVTPKMTEIPNIKNKIKKFNKPPGTPLHARKSSIHSHDSGVSSSALTMSATSFNSRSVSLTSNSNSEGEGHQFRNSRNFMSKRKPRSSSVHLGRNSRSSIRSASTTSIEHTSIRSASSGRMSRGAEKERLKLERMMNGSYMRSLTPKRSRSQDILDTRVVKSELKVIYFFSNQK